MEFRKLYLLWLKTNRSSDFGSWLKKGHLCWSHVEGVLHFGMLHLGSWSCQTSELEGWHHMFYPRNRAAQLQNRQLQNAMAQQDFLQNAIPEFFVLLSPSKVVSIRTSHRSFGAMDAGDGDIRGTNIRLCWRFWCITENCGHLDGCWVECHWIRHQDRSVPRCVLRAWSENASQDGPTAPWQHYYIQTHAYICICMHMQIHIHISIYTCTIRCKEYTHIYIFSPRIPGAYTYIYTYIDRFTNTRVNTLKNVKEQIFPFVSTTLQPRLKNGGMLTCAPPCSLFVPACSSVHRRTFANPEGNQAILKVRLAQRIWKNMDSWIRKSIGIKGQPICRSLACAREVVVSPGQPLHFVVSAQAGCLRLIFRFRPSLHYLLEQPSGSWGLKQPFMISLAAAFHMCPSMI